MGLGLWALGMWILGLGSKVRNLKPPNPKPKVPFFLQLLLRDGFTGRRNSLPTQRNQSGDFGLGFGGFRVQGLGFFFFKRGFGFRV